jgi:hypothetical protein
MGANLAITELRADRVFAERVEEHSRRSLQQRLRRADEVWAVFHECSTLAHFVFNGIEAEPKLLIRSNPVEVTLHWSGKLLPVECKVKQPGTGRVLSSDQFSTLAGEIASDVGRAGTPGLLIAIAPSDRILSTDIEWLRSQVASIGFQPTSGAVNLTHDERRFRLTIERISASTTLAELRSTADSLGLHNTFVVGVPDGPEKQRITLIIGTHINVVERPWFSWMQSIGDVATKWRNATEPGLISIHYADYLHDLESLGPQHEYRQAIAFWDAKFAAALGVRLEERFNFEPLSDGRAPGMGYMVREIVTMLPQLAGVLISCEPDLQVPGDGLPGRLYTMTDSTRLPNGFPQP